jgi:hypothetical protein
MPDNRERRNDSDEDLIGRADEQDTDVDEFDDDDENIEDDEEEDLEA